MELSVSFTDEEGGESLKASHNIEQSCLGRVYAPKEGVDISGPITIRYERHPWIEQFELDGIRAAKPKRTGYGSEDFEGFVKSLSTIYSKAYDDCSEFPDPTEYFAHVTDCFVSMAGDSRRTKICGKFCGFTENMWREGNEEMCNIALGTIILRLKNDTLMWELFRSTITDEFAEYLKLK